MDLKKIGNELLLIVLAAIVLAISFNYPRTSFVTILSLFGIFAGIILVNTLAKKFFASNLETEVNQNLWAWFQFGFGKKDHFKKPLPMIWMPILTTLLTKGIFVWMPLISFDVSPKPERITRRHGLYRYTEVTEWHIALIAAFGIIANIAVGIVGYFAGFETFAKLSVLYAVWSLVPVSNLDGSKIFFGSRNLWFAMLVIVLAVFFWSLTIV
ncbi:Uncharacterised protein [uncultured archaeon]|nr:Uncharacterised protein [uncultured archaeon]